AVVPKHRLVTGLLALAAVHLVVWVQGAHVLRYLTAALPELCIGAAYVAVQLGKRPGFGPRGPALISAIVALCAVIPLAVTAGIGVSHVLLSEPDLAWHTGFDPEGRILGWWGQFKATRSEYLVPEATYFDLTLYRVVDSVERSTGQVRPPVDLSTP